MWAWCTVVLNRWRNVCPSCFDAEAEKAGFDGERLLAECERLCLEGIVSKRMDAPYRSGKCDWVKVKTNAWREANKDRGEMFNQR